MTQDKIEMAFNQLTKLLKIEENVIQDLAEKHCIIEERQRKIFCFPFLFVCFTLIMQGFFKHNDKKHLYKKLFGIDASTNAFSDRLSQIPPAFFRDLLKVVSPQLKMIGSLSKRKKLEGYLRQILIEDGSTFSLNKKLRSVFGKGAGRGENSSLKLYMSYNVVGDGRLKAIIRKGNHSDGSRATQPKKESLELRDRAWFSMPLFLKWREQKRHFISRIKDNFDPKIMKVDIGLPEWEGKQLKQIMWEDYHGEVSLIIKPNPVKGKVLEENGKPFTLNLRGKDVHGKWFWYIVDIPDSDKLTFHDIHQFYRFRWNIEESFKEIKSSLGSNDLNGLSHENCVLNQLYMALIAWLVVKGFVSLIAISNRKSIDGFRLDFILKSSAKEEFFQLLFDYITGIIDSIADLKRKSTDLVKIWYSQARANSQKKRMAGRALARLTSA